MPRPVNYKINARMKQLLGRKQTAFGRGCAADPYLIEELYLARSGPVQKAVQGFVTKRLRKNAPPRDVVASAIDAYLERRDQPDIRIWPKLIREAIRSRKARQAVVTEAARILQGRKCRSVRSQGHQRHHR